MISTKRSRPILAVLGLSLLTACFDSNGVDSSDGLEPLDGEGVFIGDYSVSGDRITLQSPPDTEWICDANGGTAIEVQPLLPPYSFRFSIVGDSLRFENEPRTIRGPSLVDTTSVIVQTYFELKRSSGNKGIEGRWQFQAKGYTVLSGTLGAEEKAEFELSIRGFQLQLQYVMWEYEFTEGKVQERHGGDFAGEYLALWNGTNRFDSLDRPPSENYDIEVAKVDDVTVRLMGKNSGESVTLTFEVPGYSRHYASNNPAHPAYSDREAQRTCNIFNWFYQDFLDSNRRKVDGVLKPGTEFRAPSPKDRA